jgi:DNA-directed RNA polymerase specialized sigma24 family protein
MLTEDNLQNVFIKAYKNMRQFEGRSRLSSAGSSPSTRP